MADHPPLDLHITPNGPGYSWACSCGLGEYCADPGEALHQVAYHLGWVEGELRAGTLEGAEEFTGAPCLICNEFVGGTPGDIIAHCQKYHPDVLDGLEPE